MRTRSLKLALVLLVVVCLFSTLPVWGQSTSTGTIAGTITDQSGAVVPGATVTVTDTSTNNARNTPTNKDGRYVFVDLNPGIYNVTITKSGFATTKADNQEVKVGATVALNLSLQVGGANVVVEVQALGTELQTMNATVGNTITSIAIDNLPSLGRDVSTFISLQPGVGTDGAVAGAFNDQSYFTLDGGYNTNDMDGNMSVYTNSYAGDPTGGVAAQFYLSSAPTGVIPSNQDSVEEFKVNTAGQTADFNSSAGAEIKVVTKRGTSAYHGTVYEYYKDNNWSSNSWQNTFNGVPLPSFHYSRFGGSIGGPLFPKKLFDTKTFFFVNYEGFHFPNSETINRNVASPALQLGLLTDSGPSLTCPACVAGTVDYNLNNAPVTYNGTTYPANYGCAAAPGGLCDPLGLGLNPVVSTIWSKYEPTSNAACVQSLCDGANVLGFTGNLAIPLTSKYLAVRLDHDFSAKWHLNTVYHYFSLVQTGDQMVDIGGFFTGDTLGKPASVSGDPQQAWSFVAGLTTNISSNVTNDIHYSWLRNWWQWTRHAATPQVAGLGGAIEIMSGQSQTQDLGPFNSNNQQIRTRFWDGHDQMLRDDLSVLKGNHLFQLGGTYQHNWDWHQRNDSGGAINAQPVFGVGDGTSGSLLSSDIFPCTNTTTTNIHRCGSLSAAALGIVSVSSQAYTRAGPSLSLLPINTPAFDKSTIPYYNVYFSDTWHMKPTFTLTYGLGWTLEMPPTEALGKQIIAVDQADQPISTEAYLDARKRAALGGQVYNPEIGFALLGNTGSGSKYPYNPFYDELSPRIAVAWSPRFDSDSLAGKIFGHQDTVVRGGYGRQYGRLNGVTQVLLPLLGLGLIQPVACNQNLAIPGAPGAYNGNGSCGGTGSANPSNAFRIGTTASATGGPIAPVPIPTMTLPQPDYPGFNNTGAASPAALDANFRPSVIDAVDFTVQRQLSRKVSLEFGYIGRRITHDFQAINLNAVPYMMTMGGQTFANAYKNVVLQYCGGIAGLAGGGCGGTAGPNPGAVTPQPFFETALAGTGYCTPGNCTAAVVANEGGNLANAQVFSLWSDLDNGAFNFPRSMMNTPIAGSAFGGNGQYSSGVSVDSSIGYGNYNAGFVSVKMADWRGLTTQSNFTWSKALGTASIYQAVSQFTVDDPFNLSQGYGRQGFDRKFTFNTFLIYQPPFFKGQSGPMGRLLGGWTFASVFTAGSGTPIEVGTTFFDGQEFGSTDGIGFGNNNTAVPIGPTSNEHAYYCLNAGACPGQTPGNGLPVNGFKNGALEANNWRNPILGLDTRDCGAGCISGLPYWNMDLSVKKNIRVAESVSVEVQGIFTNVLNHNQWLDANFFGLFNTTGWGALGGSAQSPSGGNRQIEVGLRVRF